MRQKSSRLVRIARVRLRRWVSRLERTFPGWALLITPWGASVALHGVFLLLLAVYFYVYVHRAEPRGEPGFGTVLFADQLADDVTSLHPAERSGDPFTRLDAAEPPSLSFEPAPSDTPRINVPTLRPGMSYGSEMRLSTSEVPRHLSVVDNTGLVGVQVGPTTAPFSGRQGDIKAKLVRREGGTVESEKAVERGLDWIVRHQRPDGSWSLDTTSQCKGNGCPPMPALESDTAATGLALLPLLGAGLTHTEPNRHQDALKRGLSWLLRNQSKLGDLYTGGVRNAHFYSHAIGTMALCEGFGLSHDKRLRDPAQRAVNFIVNAQNKLDGGWRYEAGAPGDTSVFGWQLFALRSARLSGMSVPKGTLHRCKVYLDFAATDESKSTYSYMPGRAATPVMTAEGLLGRQLMGWRRDDPAMLQGAAIISGHLQQSTERNLYYWYYATQLLHNLQGKDWERWNLKVREGLVSTQVGGDGCDKGSWDPFSPEPDAWGRNAGRLYQTSLSLLTLEVYYRYLPLYRLKDDKFEGTENLLEQAEADEPAAPGTPGAKPGPAAAAAKASPAAPTAKGSAAAPAVKGSAAAKSAK